MRANLCTPTTTLCPAPLALTLSSLHLQGGMTSPVPLLLFALAVQFAAPTPGAIAQSSDAVCLGGYDWVS